MTIKERLADDFKTAMKEKNTLRKNVIQLVRAEILNVEKKTKKELDDEGCQEVIAKQVKERNKVKEEYVTVRKKEKVEEVQNEINVLTDYLPKMMTTAEIELLVDKTMGELGVNSKKAMGKVIKAVKEKTGAKADGKTISDIVKTKLK